MEMHISGQPVFGLEKNPKKPCFLMFKEHSTEVYLGPKNGSSKSDLPL